MARTLTAIALATQQVRTRMDRAGNATVARLAGAGRLLGAGVLVGVGVVIVGSAVAGA